jgi:hypothetical protein
MFSLINQIAGQFNLTTDQGITIEIKHVLDEQSNISEYKVEEKEDRYEIIIKLKKYSFLEADEIFYALTRFIQYNITLFAYNKINEESVEFLLVSAIENKTGFYCHITFCK